MCWGGEWGRGVGEGDRGDRKGMMHDEEGVGQELPLPDLDDVWKINVS